MNSKEFIFIDPEGEICRVPYPEMEDIEDWVFDRSDVETPDGCIVEPDGRCEHGLDSWLIILGIM